MSDSQDPALAPTPQPPAGKRGYSKDDVFGLLTRVQQTHGTLDKKEVLFDGVREMLVRLRTGCQEDGATEDQLASLTDTITVLENERTNICGMFFD